MSAPTAAPMPKFLHLLAPAARIYAFEPHPRTFALLRESLAFDGGDAGQPWRIVSSGRTVRLSRFRGREDGSTLVRPDPAAVRYWPRNGRAQVTCTTIDRRVPCTATSSGSRSSGGDPVGFGLHRVAGGEAGGSPSGGSAWIRFRVIPANIAVPVTPRAFRCSTPPTRIGFSGSASTLKPPPLAPYDISDARSGDPEPDRVAPLTAGITGIPRAQLRLARFGGVPHGNLPQRQHERLVPQAEVERHAVFAEIGGDHFSSA